MCNTKINCFYRIQGFYYTTWRNNRYFRNNTFLLHYVIKIVGTIKNCCFEIEHHKWLLSEEIDILPKLLLPLADNTEFDEEDNDKLPLELQYLPELKQREDDPDLRCMLLEAITQLCALKESRNFIREKNAYVILRELHKWEKDKKALLACENLVDILIRFYLLNQLIKTITVFFFFN